MKKRTLSGNIALGLFVISFVFVLIAFFSASWIVSDRRITVYIVATQIFYTITFIGTLSAAIGSLIYFLCCMPEENGFILMTYALGVTLIVSGVCAGIAVFIFSLFANQPNWMPGHENNYFGWTFGIAISSFFTLIGSGSFYFLETNIQMKKRKSLKESQNKFAMETFI